MDRSVLNNKKTIPPDPGIQTASPSQNPPEKAGGEAPPTFSSGFLNREGRLDSKIDDFRVGEVLFKLISQITRPSP